MIVHTAIKNPKFGSAKDLLNNIFLMNALRISMILYHPHFFVQPLSHRICFYYARLLRGSILHSMAPLIQSCVYKCLLGQNNAYLAK